MGDAPTFKSKQANPFEAFAIRDALSQRKEKRSLSIVSQKRTADIKERKLTKQEIGSLNDFDSITKTTSFIRDQIANNPDFLVDAARATAPFGMGGIASIGDVDARKILKKLTDASDRLLRLRSGAQINEQEFKRLRSLFPNFGDILTSMKVGNTELIMSNLEEFETEFANTRARILEGTSFEAGRDVGTQKVDNGDDALIEDIMKEFT